jgi:flagellar biosynthesis GTPase FlhF
MSESIDSLSSMFPQIDRDIIIAIFDQNKGNVEACIPQLLEISDPSTQQVNLQSETTTQSNEEQIKKDEELARKLAQDLSDEEFARQLQEEEARNRQMEIERERQERERTEDSGAQIKEKLTAGFETIKQKSREIYEKITSKASEQRNMNRNQYSNLPDNNEDSVLLGNNYETQEQYNSRPSQNHYSLNGNVDEEESLDRRNPNFSKQ